MENKYKIKVGATAEYLNSENSSIYTAKFIWKLEDKKIFLQKLDEEDENLVWVSQYEKTESQKIPVSLLELDEEIKTEEIKTEEIEEEDEEEKKIKDPLIELLKERTIEFLKKNAAGLIIWFSLGLLLLWFWNVNFKASILDAKQQNNTWAVVSSGQTIFDVYTQRNWILEAQENFEFDKQKRIREEKRKAAEKYDAEINASIEAVKLIRKEKEEIAKQKIELAK